MMAKRIFFLSVFFLFFQNSMCLKLWVVSSKFRTTEDSRDHKTYQKTRSFLKAKQWLEYKLDPELSKIELENQETGEFRGIGLIKCYVPYGIGEVDANEHEFEYVIKIRDGHADFQVNKIFSFIRDPNDIVLNYGPKNEKVAKITIRSCFRPLMDDFFEFIK
ncbi:DUF4468 domain-containing protein [Leptospira kanakyensis]|uniref:DUF4468 domain-containing protein n=1 Tax=Leptospira kanakyensis TaxID=2484968 RepID=A0A6N4Q9L6_9LEPT|nr:DUF4468 domain-containing protein [Leptospira kanakyensis]MCW7469737.1 DUF4468 domain-containing protein [Leptospira kanakyensis]TGK47485.1 DUF4468 domain-containing protein [Leptospira kanakyensis]TGK63512.1 DUF4468 domain-containing protein [Leptospira kanakyensis]TGK67116.1 DUF4468 domain-containing protein [Leptospira kanakyensis]